MPTSTSRFEGFHRWMLLKIATAGPDDRCKQRSSFVQDTGGRPLRPKLLSTPLFQWDYSSARPQSIACSRIPVGGASRPLAVEITALKVEQQRHRCPGCTSHLSAGAPTPVRLLSPSLENCELEGPLRSAQILLALSAQVLRQSGGNLCVRGYELSIESRHAEKPP
jgi:hypothetical protein